MWGIVGEMPIFAHRLGNAVQIGVRKSIDNCW